MTRGYVITLSFHFSSSFYFSSHPSSIYVIEQPVCWEPRTRRDDAAYERKLRLCALGLPSTHWASLGLPNNLVTPASPVPHPAQPGTATSTAWPWDAAQWHQEGAGLPLRMSLQPRGLVESTTVANVWRELGNVPWYARADSHYSEYKKMAPALRQRLEILVAAGIRDIM